MIDADCSAVYHCYKSEPCGMLGLICGLTLN